MTMEHPEYGHIEKLSNETRAEINKLISSLRNELGKNFDIEETSDEYVVTQGEYKTHLTKIEEVLHKTLNVDTEEKEQKSYTWALKDLLEAQIRFPELEDSGKQMEKLKELRESKKPQK